MKKAQSMPLNTIIIAALVLIVLVILVLIFTGQINIFRGGLQTCTGQCSETADGCTNGKVGYYLKNCHQASSSGSTSQGDYCCPATKDD